MKFTLSEAFEPALLSQARYLVLCGGAGSGKTEFAARKLQIRGETEGPHRFLVLRKVRSRVKESVLEVFTRSLAEAGREFELNKTDRTITYRSQGGWKVEFLFDGLDDPEKIKSIKGLTGIWIEEATEFNEKDFLQLDLRLREPTKFYKQIILSFNPDESQAEWLKAKFFDQRNPDAFVSETTVEDNPIREVREEYVKILDALAAQDETMYEIYRLGKWAQAKGQIFNWPSGPLPALAWDEIFYGGDFGYSVDPAAVVRIYRRADELWLEEVLYETQLTNPELAARMKDEEVTRRDPAYFDSAEPKSIEELCRCGINALPSEKGPDSVRAGIDFMKALKIRIVEGSPNLTKEHRSYVWKTDKEGRSLPEPVKFRDHLMSAARYGIVTHLKGLRARAVVKPILIDIKPR